MCVLVYHNICIHACVKERGVSTGACLCHSTHRYMCARGATNFDLKVYACFSGLHVYTVINFNFGYQGYVHV